MTTPVDITKLRTLYEKVPQGVNGKWEDLGLCEVFSGYDIVLVTTNIHAAAFVTEVFNRMPDILEELEGIRTTENWQTIAEMRRANHTTTRMELEAAEEEIVRLRAALAAATAKGEVTLVPDTSSPTRLYLGDYGQPVMEEQPMKMASAVVCIVCGKEKPSKSRFFCSDACIDKFSAEGAQVQAKEYVNYSRFRNAVLEYLANPRNPMLVEALMDMEQSEVPPEVETEFYSWCSVSHSTTDNCTTAEWYSRLEKAIQPIKLWAEGKKT